MTYEPWGSLTSAQYGNGLALDQSWSDGRLASKRLYNVSTSASLSQLAYLYDANDNVSSIQDQLNDANTTYYGYDDSDRLSFVSLSTSSPGTETYSYASGTNRLASLTTTAGVRSISYDGRGNTSGETRPGGVSVSTTYDGFGRLLTYARTGDPSQANAYNGLDDRVTVTSGSTTHSFVYDPDGRLIGEYDASGSPVAETIWLSPEVGKSNQPLGGDDGVGGYAPLALATGSGTGAALYWVHGNQLGVPLVTTDGSGAVTTPTGYTVLGFPGQTRSLADLYYNRYRDYDSSLGRYIQADPAGLAGGNNPYLYASANPLRYTDPLGLRATALQVTEVALEEFWWRQRLPTRKWNKWLTVGDFLGTAVGAIYWYCNQQDERKCPPCRTISGKVVPVGTIAYRPLDTPSRPQHGISGPHYNLYRANQIPHNCDCFWQPIGAVRPWELPPGAIPIEPFAK